MDLICQQKVGGEYSEMLRRLARHVDLEEQRYAASAMRAQKRSRITGARAAGGMGTTSCASSAATLPTLRSTSCHCRGVSTADSHRVASLREALSQAAHSWAASSRGLPIVNLPDDAPRFSGNDGIGSKDLTFHASFCPESCKHQQGRG